MPSGCVSNSALCVHKIGRVRERERLTTKYCTARTRPTYRPSSCASCTPAARRSDTYRCSLLRSACSCSCSRSFRSNHSTSADPRSAVRSPGPSKVQLPPHYESASRPATLPARQRSTLAFLLLVFCREFGCERARGRRGDCAVIEASPLGSSFTKCTMGSPPIPDRGEGTSNGHYSRQPANQHVQFSPPKKRVVGSVSDKSRERAFIDADVTYRHLRGVVTPSNPLRCIAHIDIDVRPSLIPLTLGGTDTKREKSAPTPRSSVSVWASLSNSH